MAEPITWSSDDVAAALGRSRFWFRRQRSRLRAAGFPEALPVVRRYDPAAVRRWIAAQQGEKTGRRSGEEPGENPPDDADAWARVLDRRAGELGRSLARA